VGHEGQLVLLGLTAMAYAAGGPTLVLVNPTQGDELLGEGEESFGEDGHFFN
jgi:hypothetical protein